MKRTREAKERIMNDLLEGKKSLADIGREYGKIGNKGGSGENENHIANRNGTVIVANLCKDKEMVEFRENLSYRKKVAYDRLLQLTQSKNETIAMRATDTTLDTLGERIQKIDITGRHAIADFVVNFEDIPQNGKDTPIKESD